MRRLITNLLSGVVSTDIAIDLGTANTLIYVQKKGIVLDEPSVVAIKENFSGSSRQHILAVGVEAKKMLGRTPGSIKAIRPMKEGVIANYRVTEDMLKYFIRRVQNYRWFFSPRVVICVPCGSTQVERRAIRESAINAGAREVYLIDEPIAVAIGSNLPVAEPTGLMVVDIGGGTAEIGILSMGSMVYSSSLKVAGDSFDSAIIEFIKRRHGTLIGEATAERIKKSIATAWSDSEHAELEVKGRDIAEGMSRSLVVTSNEVYEAIDPHVREIIKAIRVGLEQTPPELSGDIGERGILVSGGGALIRDIDRRIMDETGLPVVLADDPLTCVVRGCGRVLEEVEALSEMCSEE